MGETSKEKAAPVIRGSERGMEGEGEDPDPRRPGLRPAQIAGELSRGMDGETTGPLTRTRALKPGEEARVRDSRLMRTIKIHKSVRRGQDRTPRSAEILSSSLQVRKQRVSRTLTARLMQDPGSRRGGSRAPRVHINPATRGSTASRKQKVWQRGGEQPPLTHKEAFGPAGSQKRNFTLHKSVHTPPTHSFISTCAKRDFAFVPRPG